MTNVAAFKDYAHDNRDGAAVIIGHPDLTPVKERFKSKSRRVEMMLNADVTPETLEAMRKTLEGPQESHDPDPILDRLEAKYRAMYEQFTPPLFPK